MKVKTTWLIVAGKVSRKSCGKMIRPVRCQPGRKEIDFESVPTRRGATNQAAAVRDAFEPLPACPRTPAAPFPTWSDPQQGKAFS